MRDRNILINISIFIVIGSIYWKLGGFKKSLKWPILTKIRHPIAIILPGLYISSIISNILCFEFKFETSLIAEKYRSQINNPENNKIFAEAAEEGRRRNN